jgi:hypothetical protein
MAEESDKIKKPKAQLIKHTQNEETPASKTGESERRKVKVVMKKPKIGRASCRERVC